MTSTTASIDFSLKSRRYAGEDVPFETTKSLLANWVLLAEKLEETIPSPVLSQTHLFWWLSLNRLGDQFHTPHLAAIVDLGVLVSVPSTFHPIDKTEGAVMRMIGMADVSWFHPAYATVTSIRDIYILPDKICWIYSLGAHTEGIEPTVPETIAKEFADMLVVGRRGSISFVLGEDLLEGVWKRSGFKPPAS